ncbi:MAG TPA: S41 family peptidase [Anaeromyxobacter sp.]|nr:S41 family peptidase [Anaeromyxobacter sp.]
MRTTLLLLLLTAAGCSSADRALAGTGAATETTEAAPADPADGCRDRSLEDEPRGRGPLSGRAERVRLVCELRDALEARYVFFHQKQQLLAAEGRPPFDARRHLDACIAAERSIAREDEPLRFVDRFRRCVAAFEDGHLFLAMPRPLPVVSLGVRLTLTADGKAYVSHRDPGVARWLEEESARSPDQRLEIGDEVVAIDGRPVVDAIADLAEAIPGSSAGARIERAVDALTRRDFRYPDRREATFTVASGAALRPVILPWFVAPGAANHPLAAGWVKRTGLVTSDRIDWRTANRGAWLREGGVTEGLLRGDPIVAPADAERLQVYRGDGNQLAARLGEAASDGPAVCYAQLLSFHTQGLSGPGGKRPYVEVLREFLRGCADRGQDLILDLRQNEGGYLSHSSALAGLLTPRASISPGGALVLRATSQNEKVYEARSPSPMLGAASQQAPGRVPSEPEQILMAIRDARRARTEFTPAFLEPPLTPSSELGFAGRVVVLTGPGCMSACDRLSAILKRGHRARLVGGPTEGAGASQQETKGQSARWADASGSIGVSIPNAAMGVQTEAIVGPRQATVEKFFEEYAFENRPVSPDEPYATTLEDILDRNVGWLRAARAALTRADLPPVPDPVQPR